jgi:hypothetical protein
MYKGQFMRHRVHSNIKTKRLMIVSEVMAFHFGDDTKHISALSGKKQNFPNGATGVM